MSQEGSLTINAIYNYTPQSTLLKGTDGITPFPDTERRQLILGEHREVHTVTQTYDLDLNYGLTERWGFAVMLPYVTKVHRHVDGLGAVNNGAGELTQFYGAGIGDVRVTLKYNWPLSLRSFIVPSFGAYLPTGNWAQRAASARGEERMEPMMQIGRGNAALYGALYQSYEVIPRRLSQFAFLSYLHPFRNNIGYQFGDTYELSIGTNLVTVPWLVFTNQFNYRHMAHDSFSGSLAMARPPGTPGFPGEPILLDPNIKTRGVPNTGSTYLAYTPGFLIQAGASTTLYFFAQIPLVRDFNNNLAQGLSFVFGVTHYLPLSKS